MEEPGGRNAGGPLGAERGGAEKSRGRTAGNLLRLPVRGGGDTLAEAVVAALEGHDRLLICSDAAAGTLLEARLETVPGAEKVFDFGALSYAHPKAGAQIEKRARARLPKGTTDPVRLALARAQAARRVVGADLAAGCAEREQDCVLILSSKKGCWLRTVQRTDKPALWLLDMIRRAACGLPQAEGTGFLPARKAEKTAQPEAAPAPKKPRLARRVLVILLVLAALAALAAAGAWVYTGGNFYALPQRLHSLWADGVPHAGASFL